ncbi:MAG TPA: glycoside hydrolase, partial [Lacibacter sp.]|nr:glycoside hydrolase [Lacibacter sp.]
MLLRIIILFFLSVGNFVFAKSQAITFTIDLKSKAQTIENIGASGAWYSEVIGKNWTAEKKERMAELLFSKS